MKLEINKGKQTDEFDKLASAIKTTHWHTGKGEPTSVENNGDIYLDTNTGDIYSFSDGWEYISNIKGKDGRNPVHLTAEQPKNAIEGDIWVNNGLYVLSQGTWKEITGKNGQDGEKLRIRYSNGKLQSKYESESEWTNLTTKNELVGPQGPQGPKGDKGDKGDKGEPGKDGREIELRKTKDYIQWRYIDGVWKNLIAIADLKGATETIAFGGGGGRGGILDIIAGTNVTIDKTNPRKPIISASGGGGVQTYRQFVYNSSLPNEQAVDNYFNDQALLVAALQAQGGPKQLVFQQNETLDIAFDMTNIELIGNGVNWTQGGVTVTLADGCTFGAISDLRLSGGLSLVQTSSSPIITSSIGITIQLNQANITSAGGAAFVLGTGGGVYVISGINGFGINDTYSGTYTPNQLLEVTAAVPGYSAFMFLVYNGAVNVYNPNDTLMASNPEIYGNLIQTVLIPFTSFPTHTGMPGGSVAFNSVSTYASALGFDSSGTSLTSTEAQPAIKEVLGRIGSGWANYVDNTYTSGSPFSLSGSTDTVLPNDMGGSNVVSQKPTDIDTLYCAGYLDYDDVTTDFTVGNHFTGATSGATATILSVIDFGGGTGRLLLSEIDESGGAFQNDENIGESDGEGSATVNGTLGDGFITGKNGDGYVITVDFKVKPTNGSTTYIEDWVDIGGSVGELYRRISTFPKGINVERSIVHTTAVYTLDTWEQNGATVHVESDNTCDIYDIRFIVFRIHKAV